jgi:ABC-type phosphate transport system substrate-binding protein
MATNRVRTLLCVLALAASGGLATMACSGASGGKLAGSIKVDGSSTVYPLTVAVVDEFRKKHGDVQVDVRFSGTTAGFEQFCRGAIDIQDASRPIEANEIEACGNAGVGFIELPVAHDGLTVIVNPSNTFVKDITVAELKRAVVKQVAGNPDGLGYVGYGHYQLNRTSVRAVPIDDLDEEIGPGPIEPSPDTVRRGLYRPLSRPVFIYVNTQQLARPEVNAFVNFYTRSSGSLAARAGGIPLNPRLYASVQHRLDQKVQGSLFVTPGSKDAALDMLLEQR